jgi:hypothetical protein
MSNLLTLKITLQDAPIAITRTLQVDDALTFAQLHKILQSAMGWEDAHLHGFEIPTGRRQWINIFENPEEMEDDSALPSNTTHLKTFLVEKGDKLNYIYDYGDNWIHEVKLTKTEPQPETKITAQCTHATGACPPEDCGSVFGYEDILQALKDPKKPENEEMLEWAGIDNPSTYDPTFVDINLLNQAINAVFVPTKKSKSIKKLSSFIFGWTL